MLPLSCFLCADSKSNSSTRLPRKTTTRVSSGWVASMSILLAICKSHEGWPAAHSVPERRRILRAASLSVEVTDGVLRGRAKHVVSASARRVNAAVPIRSNLLRLEHRLQTVVDGDGWAAAILLSRRYSATRPRRHMPPARVPHRRLRLPCSFKGVGGQLFVRPHQKRAEAPERIETRVRLRSPFPKGDVAADVSRP